VQKKNKIGADVPQGRSNWYTNFHFRRSKQGHRKSKSLKDPV